MKRDDALIKAAKILQRKQQQSQQSALPDTPINRLLTPEARAALEKHARKGGCNPSILT
jgi:hypothetical protein